jgi:hypothetical protein
LISVMKVLTHPVPTQSSPLEPRVRVKRGGQWIEVDPNAPSAPRTPPEEQHERVTSAAQRHADTVSEILLLPLKLTQDERARVEHISAQIAQLPDVLAPWLDTPAGMRQYLHQTTTYLDEAQTILGAARERSHPPAE